MIRILFLERLKAKKFTVEFEVSEKMFESWKNDDEMSDEQYIQKLIEDALSRQGLKMSE